MHSIRSSHGALRGLDWYVAPVGYGDGIPRHASNRAPVWVDGRRYRIAGRVSIDVRRLHNIEPGARV